MGEAGSMIGSIFKGFSGPSEATITPPAAGGGGYTPSALSNQSALNPEPMGQGGLRLSDLLAMRR